MRQAVLSGSAQPLRSLKVTSAGKTGTAQFGNQGLTHAWFTGFAPYDNPEYVYAILVEGGGESYWSSVPVAEEILRGIFNEPLEPGQKLFSEPTDAKTSSIANEFAGER
jgi:cell division protein FtsI/penicillin-binding protein 2